MYSEDDLLQLAGLQHLVFCERQWGLIHIECLWNENSLTVEGQHLHKKVHDDDTTGENGARIARGVRLRSLQLGLSGIADVVEFHPSDDGVRLPKKRGLWQPFPVEYKRGRPKRDRCDEVQLCAQALCLEEMLEVQIPAGALFYGSTRRRYDVEFSEDLRSETTSLAERMHMLFDNAETPSASFSRKCRKCSLLPVCIPETTGTPRSAVEYLETELRGILTEEHA